MNQTRPRNPWAALGMSLVLPGFGQLYNGELNKAIWLFLGFAFLSIPGVALVALHVPGGWMLPVLLVSFSATVALWCYGMIDGWRQAKRRQQYQTAPWQVSGVYLVVLIVCDIVALPFLTGYVRDHQVESFKIPSSSMEPTVLKGDILFADKRYNCPGCKGAIERGDIAIFTYPNNRTRLYIKRIVALPGDRVAIREGRITVNGQPLSAGSPSVESEDGRSWRVIPEAAGQTSPDMALTVPSGQVFVLGDNRAASSDSRKFGTVPMADVIGKARQVWLSFGIDGIRWKRLGTRVE